MAWSISEQVWRAVMRKLTRSAPLSPRASTVRMSLASRRPCSSPVVIPAGGWIVCVGENPGAAREPGTRLTPRRNRRTDSSSRARSRVPSRRLTSKACSAARSTAIDGGLQCTRVRLFSSNFRIRRAAAPQHSHRHAEGFGQRAEDQRLRSAGSAPAQAATAVATVWFSRIWRMPKNAERLGVIGDEQATTAPRQRKVHTKRRDAAAVWAKPIGHDDRHASTGRRGQFAREHGSVVVRKNSHRRAAHRRALRAPTGDRIGTGVHKDGDGFFCQQAKEVPSEVQCGSGEGGGFAALQTRQRLADGPRLRGFSQRGGRTGSEL